MPDAAAARSLVLGEPCLGSGVVRSENPIADYDLDPCEGCGGSGIVEACDRCQLLTEMEYDN
jgi:DnaJ-class molecular chaperone